MQNKNGNVRAADPIAVATLLFTILGVIIAAAALIAQIKQMYHIDAKAASRYNYRYESGATTDIGRFAMEKGRLSYAVEFAYDDVVNQSASCRYTISYKKKSDRLYNKLISGLSLAHGSYAGTYYFLANSTKDAEYDIQIVKNTGLDRRTGIDLLVISQP